MSTKNIKKIALTTSDISGLKSSRYEKLQVSYGSIASSQYTVGDTLAFKDIPAQDIIRATVVAHSANPATLEVYPASNKNNTFNLQIPGSSPADLSYIVEYVRGTGRVGSASNDNPGEGQVFSVTISTAALAALTTAQVAALTTKDLVGFATSQLTSLDAVDKETQIAPDDL